MLKENQVRYSRMARIGLCVAIVFVSCARAVEQAELLRSVLVTVAPLLPAVIFLRKSSWFHEVLVLEFIACLLYASYYLLPLPVSLLDGEVLYVKPAVLLASAGALFGALAKRPHAVDATQRLWRRLLAGSLAVSVVLLLIGYLLLSGRHAMDATVLTDACRNAFLILAGFVALSGLLPPDKTTEQPAS